MIALGQRSAGAPPANRRPTCGCPGLPRRKVLATVVRLLETTFMRVGNEEYARSNRSFGLTTLRTATSRSAGVGGALPLPRQERRQARRRRCTTGRLARIVRRCRDLPGQELFQYVDDDGQPATIDSADVNDYLREATGSDFTAKDFRTWAGTVLAALALQEIDAGRPPPRTRRSPTRANRATPREVSARHRAGGETAGEHAGGLQKVLRAPRRHLLLPGRNPGRSAEAARDAQMSPRRPAGLRPDEAAVLALLQRRLAEDKRGTRLERSSADRCARAPMEGGLPAIRATQGAPTSPIFCNPPRLACSALVHTLTEGSGPMNRIERLRNAARLGSLGLTLLAGALGCAHDEQAAAPPATASSMPGGAGASMAGTTDAASQAAAGGALYGQFCGKCHGDAGQGTEGAPPVVGANALPLDPRPTQQFRKNQFHTAKDVFDFVGANMPPKGPKPTLDQYLDILAFDLKANGIDLTGKPALTPDNLSSIVIHP